MAGQWGSCYWAGPGTQGIFIFVTSLGETSQVMRQKMFNIVRVLLTTNTAAEPFGVAFASSGE